MPRIPRLRTVPWLVVAELAMAARRHWYLLEPAERARLRDLVTRSRGRRGNLTPDEREDLRYLVRRLEPGGLVREALPLRGRLRRRP